MNSLGCLDSLWFTPLRDRTIRKSCVHLVQRFAHLIRIAAIGKSKIMWSISISWWDLLRGDEKHSSPLVSTPWLGMYCPWAAPLYCQWSRIIIEESVERIWFVLFRLGEPSQWGVHKERRQNCSFGPARCEGHPHWLARQSERHHHQMYGCEATYSSCNIHMWNMWLWNLPGLELVTSPCVSGLCRDISTLIYVMQFAVCWGY